uniref:Uncharacterized protein n=1 Tax=Romanomermis culicivorax TaxID=13658 RepID=A0A915J8Y9_ROMCU
MQEIDRYILYDTAAPSIDQIAYTSSKNNVLQDDLDQIYNCPKHGNSKSLQKRDFFFMRDLDDAAQRVLQRHCPDVQAADVATRGVLLVLNMQAMQG